MSKSESQKPKGLRPISLAPARLPTIAREELDQTTVLQAEWCPVLWAHVYYACLDQGFTEEQAMRLLTATIRTQSVLPEEV